MAVSPNHDGRYALTLFAATQVDNIVGTGYINRDTLQVVLIEEGRPFQIAIGPDEEAEAIADDQILQTDPSLWLKIPKLDDEQCLIFGSDGEWELLRAFAAYHGLPLAL